MTAVAVVAPAAAMPPGRPLVAGQVGTVDTLAGPGFCRGSAAPEPASTAVGALAASTGGGGALWYESGPLGAGVLTKVLSSASVVVEHTGASEPRGPHPSVEGAGPTLRGASNLASDGRGGALVAQPTAIMQFGQGASTLAGVRSAASGGDSPAMGDGGPLVHARFRRVVAISTDSSGNTYVADELDRRRSTIAVRFANRSPDPVTFYAGTALEINIAPGTIDTIAGTAATAGSPALVAVAPVLAASGGRLYVAASQPGSRRRATVRMINLGGAELTAHGATVAPGATATVATVVGGQRVTSVASDPVSPLPGIAADEGGNLFLADRDNHRVRRLGPGGETTTFAGTGAPGFNGNDRAAVTAHLDRPYDVEVGAGGRVYVSDAGNAQVRYVDKGGTIHAALGNGASNTWVCGGSARSGTASSRDQPHLGLPMSLAATRSGDVYLTGPPLAQVQRISASGGLRSIVGGSSVGGCGEPAGCEAKDGEPARAARLEQPVAIALNRGGGMYVQETSRIRLVNLGRRQLHAQGVTVAPGTVRTVAGGGTAAAGSGRELRTDGKAIGAQIGTAPAFAALAADRTGNLFIADGLNRSVRQVDTDGRISTLLAGPPPGAASRQDPGCCPCCAVPTGLALDAADNLYVADLLTRQVWFLNRGTSPVAVHGVAVAPGAVVPVAGTAGGGGSDDEGVPARDAQLAPLGVAVDKLGNLFVVHGHTVRRVDASGNITTVAGTGQQGFNGDGLEGRLTALNYPTQVALDTCGNLLIADSRNDRVRRLNLSRSCVRVSLTGPSATARRPWLAAGAAAAAALAGVASVMAFRRRRGRRASPAAAGKMPQGS